ncbi:MAG: hypothetical protein K9J24_12315, partial [Bacteroidales bacterium]|nr:hypothetical protein [Bacteroidales bacterium]
MIRNNFIKRHNGPRESDLKEMLEMIGVESLDQLMDETLPEAIRLKEEMKLGEGLSEQEYMEHIKGLAAQNKIYKSYIGL